MKPIPMILLWLLLTPVLAHAGASSSKAVRSQLNAVYARMDAAMRQNNQAQFIAVLKDVTAPGKMRDAMLAGAEDPTKANGDPDLIKTNRLKTTILSLTVHGKTAIVTVEQNDDVLRRDSQGEYGPAGRTHHLVGKLVFRDTWKRIGKAWKLADEIGLKTSGTVDGKAIPNPAHKEKTTMTTLASLIDPKATDETVALFHNLRQLSEKHVLFGHQHATEYGHGWFGDVNRSDVHSVTGSHPAVIGVDLNGLSGRSRETIEKNKVSLRENIVATYDRGGLTTLSWHLDNPVSGTDFNWKDGESAAAVGHLIPGGSYHDQYKVILADIADLALSSVGKDGTLAPMIFRPFHEFDGAWFWWGKPHCIREEFIALWHFTVSHLRDSLGVHNFLYAFSPDCLFQTEADYLERYPGDAWVDLVGMDDYADFGRDGKYDVEAGIRKLKIVSGYAQKSGKLAAFTETGLESIANPIWWTHTLLPTLKTEGLQLCYVLVWRNDVRSSTHYYAPYPGHPSVPDFLTFYQDPLILFENDLPPLYTKTHEE